MRGFADESHAKHLGRGYGLADFEPPFFPPPLDLPAPEAFVLDLAAALPVAAFADLPEPEEAAPFLDVAACLAGAITFVSSSRRRVV